MDDVQITEREGHGESDLLDADAFDAQLLASLLDGTITIDEIDEDDLGGLEDHLGAHWLARLLAQSSAARNAEEWWASIEVNRVVARKYVEDHGHDVRPSVPTREPETGD